VRFIKGKKRLKEGGEEKALGLVKKKKRNPAK